jgi:CubicO group peptidase (beta-lactamase class C family)
MKKARTLVLFVLLLTCAASAQTPVAEFDRYAEAARKEWDVPGMAVAVVKDSKVVFARGYGVRELGKPGVVDTKTLFGAMSTTKAMTVAALAMLVDEGKVNWDDKVIDHVPEFRLSDAYVTRDLRVKDLLTHNSGLGNTDLLWDLDPDISPQEILERLQYPKLSYPLRGGYTYQNLMYFLSGQVIERASGKSWEEFITERLFRPLGMNDTYPNYKLSLGYSNRSMAHFRIDGKIEKIQESRADAIAPAGAAWSTADDIGKWVNFMLNNPEVNGKRLIKPDTFAEILKPHVILTEDDFYPTAKVTKPNWITYGYAWFQNDYRGEMIQFHTGSLAGRTAIIGLLPSKGVGVYVFGNLDHAEVRHALMYKAFDLFGFGDGSRDWSKELKALYDGLEKDRKKQEEETIAKQVNNTEPSLPIAEYAGTYSDPYVGEIKIAMEDGGLVMKAGKEESARLSHWHYDTFKASWEKRWAGWSLFSFNLDPVTGKVASLNFAGRALKKKE